MEADTSDYATGGVLSMRCEDKKWRPVKGAKEVLDCDKQKVMNSGSPQLCAKGSERRITKRG